MSTHENIIRDETIEPASDRRFGCIVGAILTAIGLYQLVQGTTVYIGACLGGAGILLILFGIAAPRRLHTLNVAWTRFGLLLGRIVSPIIMLIVYAISIVPIGLVLRVFGKDLLGLRRRDEKGASYWIARDPPGPPPESLKDQF